MKEVLVNIDWATLIEVVWKIVLFPIVGYVLGLINKYAEDKRIVKYKDIVIELAKVAAKNVYETFVKELKHTDVWNSEAQKEALETAKSEIVYALSDSAYKLLKAANQDFERWMENAIEAAIYDLKREGKNNE